MEDMIYEGERSERSSPEENLRPSSVKCEKTVSTHKESVLVNCHKLIEDFRFLLRSEFYDLATISFQKTCSQRKHLKSDANSSHNTNFEGISQSFNDSLSNPRVWNMVPTQLTPGTLLKMLLSQIEQNMDTFALPDRSQMFRRNYSKLVIPFIYLYIQVESKWVMFIDTTCTTLVILFTLLR